MSMRNGAKWHQYFVCTENSLDAGYKKSRPALVIEAVWLPSFYQIAARGPLASSHVGELPPARRRYLTFLMVSGRIVV